MAMRFESGPAFRSLYPGSPPRVGDRREWIGRIESPKAFLDEFRAIAPTCDDLTDAPEFVVLNTFLPQNHSIIRPATEAPRQERWFMRLP